MLQSKEIKESLEKHFSKSKYKEKFIGIISIVIDLLDIIGKDVHAHNSTESSIEANAIKKESLIIENMTSIKSKHSKFIIKNPIKKQNKVNIESKLGLNIGDHVYTIKGSRVTNNTSAGIIVGFCKWKHFDAAIIKKDNGGKSSVYLAKNLRLLEKKN